MEEIIKKAIEIDNKAKEITKNIEQQNNQFENIVEAELMKQKLFIDAQLKEKIEKKQQEYDKKLNETIEIINSRKKQDIQELNENYQKSKNQIVEEILKTIITV